MPKLMPIPRVRHMREIIPTSRRTNNCGGHMFTSGPDVRNSHASNSNINHGSKSHQNRQHWVALAGRMLV